MAPKHTPGPKVVKRGDGSLAIEWPDGGISWVPDGWAHKLAAAPEQNEALAVLLPWIEAHCQPGDRWAALLCRAALSKARGEGGS